jgi:hypothetical protein
VSGIFHKGNINERAIKKMICIGRRCLKIISVENLQR